MLGETLGSYQVKRQLGEGGMGVVYLAEHPLLKRLAAIKLLRPEYSKNPEMVNRFFNEARSTTLIKHPGLVDIFDFGFHKDGAAYIVMELLEGETLAALLGRERRIEDVLTIALARQLASALSATHRKGIVHRDLKPENIFLVPDRDVPGGSRVKILDFGIAKLAGEARGPGSDVKTRTGMVIGTPRYMAPEQCSGAGDVDQRADIYALGCILFEMVSGQTPFQGPGNGDIIASHLKDEPPKLSTLVKTVSPELEALVTWCLAKRPAARPASMEDVLAELDRMSPALRGGLGTAPGQGFRGVRPDGGSQAPTMALKAGGLPTAKTQLAAPVAVLVDAPLARALDAPVALALDAPVLDVSGALALDQPVLETLGAATVETTLELARPVRAKAAAVEDAPLELDRPPVRAAPVPALVPAVATVPAGPAKPLDSEIIRPSAQPLPDDGIGLLAQLREPWVALARWEIIASLVGFGLLVVAIFACQRGFVSILDDANLAFHEAGHPIYGVFGEGPALYGGTLGQLTFPFLAALIFYWRRRPISVAFCGVWFFENFLNIARYAADARAQALPLTGGGEHDWTRILTRWGALDSDLAVGRAFVIIGWTGMLGCVAWLCFRWWRDDRAGRVGPLYAEE